MEFLGCVAQDYECRSRSGLHSYLSVEILTGVKREHEGIHHIDEFMMQFKIEVIGRKSLLNWPAQREDGCTMSESCFTICGRAY